MPARDTTVILVSDHGFHSGSERNDTDGFKDPTSWHRPFGIVCGKGPGFKKNETLYGACLLDVTPTILSLFGLPIGDDMDGRPWLETFDREVRPGRIPSWDLVEGDCGMHSEERREDPVQAAEAIRHLGRSGIHRSTQRRRPENGPQYDDRPEDQSGVGPFR